jgi:imidazolonepropionase-like amidohydrolase
MTANTYVRHALLGIALFFCFLPCVQETRVGAQSDRLALTGGRLVASPDAAPINDATVVIAGGHIVAIGPRERVSIPAGVRSIDCTGLTVLPGFQNSHVHFTESKWNDAAIQPAAKLASQLLQMFTQYGFTSVVDTTSLLANTVTLRKRIASGEIEGPRILTAGLALYPPNGVPYYVRDVVPPELFPLLLQPSTPTEATAMVRNGITSGADIVKLFTGSNVTRSQIIPMPRDVALAAVTEAHTRRKLVFAHPGNVAGLEVAIEAGVDVVAHVVESTSGLTPSHWQRMKQRQMSLVPTLKLLGDGDDREAIRNEVRDYARLGGEILFGTDVGFLTEYDPSREFELMESAGLTWRQILASLTTNPADRFGEAAIRGRLVSGLDADIVVVGGDPSQTVRAFTDVRYTIKSGRLVYSR